MPPTDSVNDERVGMAVGGDRPIAQRPRIDDQADFAVGLEVAAEDVIAAFRERLPHRKPCRCRALPFKQRIGLLAQEPTRLVVEGAGLELEVVATEKNRPVASSDR